MKHDYRAVCTSTGYSRAYYVIKSASFHVNVESALLHLPLLLATHVTHTCSLKHTFSPQFILILLNIFKLPFFSFFSWLLYFRMLEKQSVELQQHNYTVCVERVHSFDFESVWRYILICVVHVYICASDVVNTLKHTTYFTTMTSSVVLSLLCVDVWFCERSPSNVLTSRMTYNLRKRIHQWCQSVNQPGKHQHQWGLN